MPATTFALRPVGCLAVTCGAARCRARHLIHTTFGEIMVAAFVTISGRTANPFTSGPYNANEQVEHFDKGWVPHAVEAHTRRHCEVYRRILGAPHAPVGSTRN